MENNVLDLRTKLIDRMLSEWVNTIENADPESICILIEELREELLKGA